MKGLSGVDQHADTQGPQGRDWKLGARAPPQTLSARGTWNRQGSGGRLPCLHEGPRPGLCRLSTGGWGAGHTQTLTPNKGLWPLTRQWLREEAPAAAGATGCGGVPGPGTGSGSLRPPRALPWPPPCTSAGPKQSRRRGCLDPRPQPARKGREWGPILPTPAVHPQLPGRCPHPPAAPLPAGPTDITSVLWVEPQGLLQPEGGALGTAPVPPRPL